MDDSLTSSPTGSDEQQQVGPETARSITIDVRCNSMQSYVVGGECATIHCEHHLQAPTMNNYEQHTTQHSISILDSNPTLLCSTQLLAVTSHRRA